MEKSDYLEIYVILNIIQVYYRLSIKLGYRNQTHDLVCWNRLYIP